MNVLAEPVRSQHEPYKPISVDNARAKEGKGADFTRFWRYLVLVHTQAALLSYPCF